MHKLVRSLVISCPKSFTRSKINILNVNFPQCESLSSLQSFHSVSSEELEDKVITDPKIYQFLQSGSPWNRHFYICSYSGYISSLLHLEYLPSYFFPHQNIQNSLGPFISKLPVTICNHFMHM